MRVRRQHFQLGARVAVGLLAALWLWNLRIVTNTVFQQGQWPIFPAVDSISQPVDEEPIIKALENDESTLEDDELISRSSSESDDSPELAVTNKLNTTLPPAEYRVPAFIIIGAQKSATQSLRSYLSQHPLVHFPSVIEPHFFDWGYKRKQSREENLNAYIKVLNGKKNHDCRVKDCITGENTPSYLFSTEHVPPRMKQVCPWAKLIVVLRDPAKRAFSQCNMLIEKHEVKTSFREHFQFDTRWMNHVGLATNKVLTTEEEDQAWLRYHKHRKSRKMMLGRGLYEVQLRQWFRFFPREQFLILKSEELEFNLTATMTRVFDFLGIPDQPLKKDKKKHVKRYTATMSNATRDELYDFYRPYNKRLEGLLGPEWRGIWEEPS